MNNGKLIGTLLVIIFSSIFGVIMNSLQLLKTVNATTAVVFIFSLFRATAYSPIQLYLQTAFPSRYFGRLNGIARISMGIISIVVIGLSKVLEVYQNQGLTAILSTFLVLMVLTLVFPIYCLRKIKAEKTEINS